VDAGCLGDEWESNFDDAVQERAVALASSTLERLTAYRVSECTTILRPCSRSCGWGSMRHEFRHWAGAYEGSGAYNWGGTWYNACGCVDNSCGHTAANTIWLPQPMGGVEKVKINGTLLVEGTDYWVNGNALLAKGATVWPLTQDLTLPDTQANTFSVEFHNAIRPDDTAAYACALLAIQYARACSGKGKCELPSNVTTVVRQGVSFTLPSGAFPNGETGIREVDAFIALYNPKHRVQPPQVYVP
jgi:hypothetical protein